MFLEFSPQKLGFQDPILTNAHIFQLGGLFNHQLVIVEYIETINVCFTLSLSTLPVTNVVLFTTLKRLDNFVVFFIPESFDKTFPASKARMWKCRLCSTGSVVVGLLCQGS